MSSPGFSASPNPEQRISVRRRGAAPTSATASAADEAIRQLIDGRRRRNKYGIDAAAFAGQPNRRKPGAEPASRDSAGKAKAIGAQRFTLPPAFTRGAGIAGIVTALAILVVNVAPGEFQPRRGITGTVELNGKPLADAVLEFHAAGQAHPAIVLSTSDIGMFRRPGHTGLAEGSYAVVVKSGYIMPSPTAERGLPARIPDRYLAADSTPLRVKVAAEDVSVRLVLSR